MNIDVPIEQAELDSLAACLPRGLDVEAIAATLAKAGAIESILVATEQADAPSTPGDMRRFKVYCLIKAGLEMSKLEPVVAAVFKITPRQARGVVDSALAKYSSRLSGDVIVQIKAALDAATPGDQNDLWVTLNSNFVEQRLMEFLAGKLVEMPAKMTVGRRWRFRLRCVQRRGDGVRRRIEGGSRVANVPEPATLDKAITDVMASLAVLLVFVVAFFSALLGPVDAAIQTSLPGDPDQQPTLFRRLRRLMIIVGAFLTFSVTCLVTLLPLTIECLTNWRWIVDGRIPTDRGVLLLIDVSMAALVVAAAGLLIRVVRRRDELREVVKANSPKASSG